MNLLSSRKQRTGLPVVFLPFVALILSSALNAQTDFSGSWKFNKAGSSPGQMKSEYDGVIIRQISQNATTFSFNDVYKNAGNKDWSTASEEFALDGMEQVTKGDYYTIRKSAKWSAGKDSLTLIYVNSQSSDGVSQDFLNKEIYFLSDEKTLVIETFAKNPVEGEKTGKNIYNRE